MSWQWDVVVEGEREREMKERERDVFQGMPPVTYFLQLGPTSNFPMRPNNAITL
jgi:hypothetical protein